ncbi:hypothetical protein BKA62DRAFT_800131 [Auriculariales sp. MPI-PUGE-AT-0066]|nr:hypothetical protein BKA62DRAFT_800131 [Auriculariales sp. MPI-PUGE-AT-0066]
MAAPIPGLALTSFQTAIVFLPSPDVQRHLNLVRSGHDKSFPRWTAHLTAVFPFVEPENLAHAAAKLRAAIALNPIQPIDTELDHVDSFSMRTYHTVYLAPSAPSRDALQKAWKVAATTFGYKGRRFVSHATLGQAHSEEALSFWKTDSFVFLRKDDEDEGRMKIVDVVHFSPDSPAIEAPISLCAKSRLDAYFFDPSTQNWSHTPSSPAHIQDISVATYNCLHDDAFPFADRASGVVSAILKSGADLIALQEITEDSLEYILAHVHDQYCWSTHSPGSVFPLARNVVVLAKTTVPFSWEHVTLEDKKKPAILVQATQSDGKSLVIAAVHLSAGFEQTIRAKREAEMAALVSHLQKRYPSDSAIILGDFNAQPGDGQLIDANMFSDAWVQGDGSEETEATFDPASNELADHTARRFSNEPRRYDRIFFQHQSLEVTDFELFGLPEAGARPASDHWGVVATLRSRNRSTAAPTAQTKESEEPVTLAQLATSPSLRIPSFSLDNVTDEQLAAAALPETPSTEERAKRAAVVARLRNVICGPAQGTGEAASVVRLHLVPVGSFALGVDTLSSDVDCLAIGNISPKAFWSLARHSIRAQRDATDVPVVKLRRFVSEAAVQMMQIEINDIHVDLQYTCAPQLAESWNDEQDLSDDSDAALKLSMAALRTLNAWRDLQYIQKAVGSARLDVFRLAHRSLRSLAKQRGIWGARFGFLGSFHLSILLVSLLERLPTNQPVSTNQLVALFLEHYSSLNWSHDVIQLRSPKAYPRKPREAMVILSPSRPLVNVSSIASGSTTSSLSHELAAACQLLREGASWDAVCGGGIDTFITSHESFAKVDVAYWGSNSLTGRGLVGHLESRLVQVLTQLQPKAVAPGIRPTVRLWPQRLADSVEDPMALESLQAYFLIGIDNSASSGASSATTHAKTLSAFAENIQTHTRYYDPAHAFVSAVEVTRASLANPVPDAFVWPDVGVDPSAETDSEEDDLNMDADAASLSAGASGSFELDRRKRDGKKSRKTATTASSLNAPSSTRKLRPSVDVYNRLMWDTSIQKEDHIIGYEDRFKGVKEMPLLSWKREVEDEAFIPFHRVQYFKRRSDNVKLWDRKNRLDTIFGSGIIDT